MVASLKMSVIVILLLCLTSLVTKRYTAGWRYYSWLAVIIVFFIPFGTLGLNYKIDTTNTMLDFKNSPRLISVWTDRHAPAYEAKEEISAPDYAVKNAADEEEAVSDTRVIRHKNPVDYVLMAALLWLSTAGLYFIAHIRRYALFKAAVKRCAVPCCEASILRVLSEEKEKLRISAEVPVRVSNLADTPMLTGLFHPIILLPDNEYSETELHFIFRHELIHYRRGDIWYQFIMLIFLSLHWFNPIAHIMTKTAELDGETSCDEAVLKDAAHYDERICYGEMLLHFLRGSQQKKSYLTTAFWGGKQGMKKRLTLIKSKDVRKKGTAAMAVLIALTIMSSVCAAAADSNLLTAAFAGDTSSLTDLVQTPKQSVTDGKYTFTLEQYLVSKSQALVLFSIEGLTAETITELNQTDENGYSTFFDLDEISFGPVDSDSVKEFSGYGWNTKSLEFSTKTKKYYLLRCTSMVNEDEGDFYIRFNRMETPQTIIIPMKSNLDEKTLTLGKTTIKHTPIGIAIEKNGLTDEEEGILGLYFRMKNGEISTFNQLYSMESSKYDEHSKCVRIRALSYTILPFSELKSIILNNVEYDIIDPTKTKPFTPDKTMIPFEMKPYYKEQLWLPLKEFCQKAGADLTWDGKTNSAAVTYRGSAYVFTEGSTKIKINGETVDYYESSKDNTIFIDENNRMIVPVRVLEDMRVDVGVANSKVGQVHQVPLEERIWLIIP